MDIVGFIIGYVGLGIGIPSLIISFFAMTSAEKAAKSANESNEKILLNSEMTKQNTEITKELLKELTLNSIKRGEDNESLIATYDKVNTNPQTADDLFLKGVAKQTKDYYEEAIEWYKKAIKLNPDFVEAYYNMGSAYRNLNGQYEKAIEYYKKAIELKPDLVEAYLNMGVAYCNWKRQYEKAIDCYKKAIELKPNLAVAHLNMGVAYDDWDGQYEKAIKCYKKAIELEPDYTEAYFNMGLAYRQKRDEKQTIGCMKKAAELGDADAKKWLCDNNITD
jgi:tetratricopeptide (TPR) repeat protein